MNLTPPPSQNSHAIRWHCTAEYFYYYYYLQISSRNSARRFLRSLVFVSVHCQKNYNTTYYCEMQTTIFTHCIDSSTFPVHPVVVSAFR